MEVIIMKKTYKVDVDCANCAADDLYGCSILCTWSSGNGYCTGL